MKTLPYTSEPIPVEGTTAGSAFVAQAAAFAHDGTGVTGYLPVSVRGDRLGILAVSLPEEPQPQVWAELERFAEALAHELFVADRDTDLYVQARRSSRLTLAAEMQWQPCPAGRAPARNSPSADSSNPPTRSTATASTGPRRRTRSPSR